MTVLKKALDLYRKGDVKRNTQVAQFCGVSYRTALEWGRKRDPQGEPLNKLWYFLEANGVQLVEVQKLHPVVRMLGRMVAFGVIEPAVAMSLLRLEGHYHHLWPVLQGRVVPLTISKGVLTRQHLTKTHGKTLRQAFGRAAEHGLVPFGLAPREFQADEVEVAEKPQANLATAEDSHIVVAAAFVSALTPLLKRIVDDGKESVRQLRAALDDDTFYDVLDSMKAMSSRRAHQFYRGKE